MSETSGKVLYGTCTDVALGKPTLFGWHIVQACDLLAHHPLYAWHSVCRLGGTAASSERVQLSEWWADFDERFMRPVFSRADSGDTQPAEQGGCTWQARMTSVQHVLIRPTYPALCVTHPGEGAARALTTYTSAESAACMYASHYSCPRPSAVGWPCTCSCKS